jgi:RNA polymerase sigma-70 factor (ECF subfamily)
MNEEYINNLVEKIQNGDKESFSLLYKELFNPIYKFCFFKLPNKETTEDITSEVILNIFSNIDSYSKQKGIKFISWVFRIAQNKIIDFFRVNKENLELKEEIICKKSNIDKDLNNDFLKNKLQNALKNLPHSQSQSIILKYFSGLNNTEISNILDKSETAVRILQSRGLKSLKKYINYEDFL